MKTVIKNLKDIKIDYERNPKILNDFINYLFFVKNLSEGTIKLYADDLYLFFKFIKEYKNIEVSIKQFNIFIVLDITKDDIFAYLVHLNYNKDNTGITRSIKLTAIRTFYKWLFNTNPITTGKKNPTTEIQTIKPYRRFPKHLSLQKAKKIVRCI